MIKKLKEHDIIDPKTDKGIGKIGCDLREIMDKLNELVDAVNEIMTWRFETDEDSDWYDDPKCREQPAENVLTKSLRMDKEFTEEECKRLQTELERTRKALDVAVDALTLYANSSLGDMAKEALKQITAFEQKDVK